MNSFTKIKLARKSLDGLSTNIQKFISEHGDLFDIKSDESLCENGDYLFFDESKDHRLKYHSHELGDLYFDFEAELKYHRHQHYALSKEPLAKSLGLVGNKNRLIWDATCGTAKDALLINHFGGQVIGFERNPIVYLLLLSSKEKCPVNIEFLFGDSLRLELDHLPKPDVIYYDPMFPEKNKKSALPRKEMQIFKSLLGPDTDSIKFLTWAKTKAIDRVVVKRPLKAEFVHPNPSASYEGKSTRYDMYKIF
jgi:16S rRNA (guanine1516-N2)-methyltransferase